MGAFSDEPLLQQHRLVAAGAVFGLMHNGWVLAAIGSTESVVAGLTVVFADRISQLRFRRKLERLL